MAMTRAKSKQITHKLDATGAATVNLHSKLGETVSVKDFGAVGDGTTNDSASIQAAASAAATLGASLKVPYGNYRVNSLTIACSLDMDEGAIFTYNGAQNGTLMTITSSGKRHGKIYTSGNTSDCTCVSITGSDNHFELLCAENITASATSSTAIYGVAVTGAGNTLDHVVLNNLQNTGQPNGSFPQGVYVASDATINLIDSTDGRACLVTGSSSTQTTVGEMRVNNAADNGIYQLGGSISVNWLVYQGTEEPVVFKGTGTVNELEIIGAALGVGVENCGDVSIGRIYMQPSGASSPKFIVRTRSGNTSCGRINIGEVAGKFRGSTLWALDYGTVDYFEVGGNVVFEYDTSICTNTSAWASLTACEGFKIGSLKVEIVDINNAATGSTIFQMTAPTTNLARRSYMSFLDVVLYASDGSTASAATFRGISMAQTLIESVGVAWRTDIGPYVIGSTGNVDDSTNAIPAGGTWVRGKRFVNSAAAAGGTEGWVCVLAGTPGTWKTFGSISP